MLTLPLTWLTRLLARIPKWQRTFIGVAIATLLFSLALPQLAVEAKVEPKHYTEVISPPLPQVRIPKYQQFEMQNGIQVFLIEDHELPLVGGLALFPMGSRTEPGDKVGLSAITGQVMRSGGTVNQSPEALNQFLENRAASVETFMGTTASGANFSSLKGDFEPVLATFAEVLRQPAFATEQFELAKSRMAGGIARRNDTPQQIVNREFDKLIYGKESPFGRTVEYATLANITREDAIAHYRNAFQPERMILGVIGDFDSATIKPILQATLEDWQPEQADPEGINPDAIQQAQDGIFFVDQPQLNQSFVQMGHLGGKLDDPDYPALSVMNQVLNGFGGRLFNEVRSRQGLAYSVYASWSPQYDYPGVFVAGGETRAEATVQFIQSLRQELEKIRTTAISEAELQSAKDKVLNAFVFNFQDPSQTLSRLLWYELFGYPKDFIFTYQKGVKAATTADVLRVAKTYLQPDKTVTLVVGNSAKIQPPLDNLTAETNAVQRVDITIAE